MYEFGINKRYFLSDKANILLSFCSFRSRCPSFKKMCLVVSNEAVWSENRMPSIFSCWIACTTQLLSIVWLYIYCILWSNNEFHCSRRESNATVQNKTKYKQPTQQPRYNVQRKFVNCPISDSLHWNWRWEYLSIWKFNS